MPPISSLKDIKKGLVLEFKNEPYLVLEANFLRLQQRKPTCTAKMRHLVTKRVLEYSFKQGQKISTTVIDRQSANFLYHNDNEFFFMNNQTFDQVSLNTDILGDAANYLTEGLNVNLLTWNGKLISVELPPKVVLSVTETEPGTRGDTAQGSVTKPATLASGYTLQVPIFVKTGDKIRVSTETGEYVERV